MEQTSENHGGTAADGKSQIVVTKTTIKYSFQNVSQKWVQLQILLKDQVIHADPNAPITPAPSDWQKKSTWSGFNPKN